MNGDRTSAPAEASPGTRSKTSRLWVESEDANPFPGPKPYSRAQVSMFFGRDHEIEQLVSLILSTSTVLLHAKSGAGKSSLLHAGVLPLLHRDFAYEVLPTVRFDEIRIANATDNGGATSSNPFINLVLNAILPQPRPEAEASERVSLSSAFAAVTRRQSGETLLLLDQFEEIFSNAALWQERKGFFSELTLALEAHPRLHAVIAIRSDYLADLT